MLHFVKKKHLKTRPKGFGFSRFKNIFCSILSLIMSDFEYFSKRDRDKNDSIHSKKIPILKLPLFFITYIYCEGKSATISRLDIFFDWMESFSRILLQVLSSKSSVQSAVAVKVGQNSSASVARSVAAIWPLLLFKQSQLMTNNSMQQSMFRTFECTWVLLAVKYLPNP